jgi:hypothetical protein
MGFASWKNLKAKVEYSKFTVVEKSVRDVLLRMVTITLSHAIARAQTTSLDPSGNKHRVPGNCQLSTAQGEANLTYLDGKSSAIQHMVQDAQQAALSLKLTYAVMFSLTGAYSSIVVCERILRLDLL